METSENKECLDVKKYIQSVSRAAAILRCFENNEELGLTEISKMVGLHKSTTAGITGTLKHEKFLEQTEENGKFRLGTQIFRLSRNIKFTLKEICLPYLSELLDFTGETVNLVLRDGDSVMYIEKKESLHSMRICTNIGKRLPLYCTAVGKAILAFLQDEEIQELLDKIKLVQYTDKTINSKDVLVDQIQEIRRQGYACDMEELEYGLVCVAVPIFDNRGKAIGGISVSGPSMRMTNEVRTDIAEKLLDLTSSLEDISGGKYIGHKNKNIRYDSLS